MLKNLLRCRLQRSKRLSKLAFFSAVGYNAIDFLTLWATTLKNCKSCKAQKSLAL
jgi:hypothetical protein